MAIEKQINIVVKETGIDKVNKQVDELNSSLNKVSKTNDGVAKSMGDSSNAVLENGGAMGLLNDATSGLAMTVKDAVEASVLFTKSQKLASIQQAIYSTVVGTSTGAMKLFRIALVATGIGALVVGLGLLIANFDKVKKVVLNVVPGLAKVGDFVENLVNGFTDFIGVTSEAERALASLTEQADKSLAMNKKFMAEEGDLVNKYTKAKIDAKNAYNEAIKEEGANQKKLAERLNRELLAIDKMHNDDLAKAKKEAQDKEDEANKTRTEKQKADRLKAQEDAKKAQEDEDKRKEEKIKLDAEKAIALDEEIKQAQLDVEEFRQNNIDKETEQEATAMNNRIARKEYEYDEAKKIADDQLALDKQIQETRYNSARDAGDALSNLANLLGGNSKKNQALQKGIAVAQIAIDTAQAISNAIPASIKAGAEAGKVAGPAAAVVTPAVTASTYIGLAAMITGNALKAKSILSGGGGSGGSSSSGGGSTMSAPSFNLVQGTGTNQIAQGLSQQGAPIKAYVVSSDVSTSQSLDRNIVSEASLG